MSKQTAATKTITIQGLEFEVLTPYAEGHTCTEAEAKALNQTRNENIRNNMAKVIKTATEGMEEVPADLHKELQTQVSEYDSEYEFTLASVGGGRKSKDPVDVEATKMARAAINAKLKEQGRLVKDVDKDAYAAAVAKLSEHENIRKAAADAVAKRSKLVDNAIEELDF